MDPITIFTMTILGGMFLANRVATVFASRKKGGGPKPADNSNGLPEERMGSGGVGESGHDAGREARELPHEHFPLIEPERATAPPVSAPPAAPSDVAVLQLVRDRTTGRFSRKAA